MRKLRSSLLGLLLAAACFSQQSSTQLVTPEIRRVGDRLACKCGACNNTVATCQMLECHYTHPTRQKIAGMQQQGMKDDDIVKAFVQESGIVALAAPPTSGFNLLGWIMPFIVIGIGLTAIAIYWKRFRRRPELASLSPQELDPRYAKRIEKEVAELE